MSVLTTSLKSGFKAKMNSDIQLQTTAICFLAILCLKQDICKGYIMVDFICIGLLELQGAPEFQNDEFLPTSGLEIYIGQTAIWYRCYMITVPNTWQKWKHSTACCDVAINNTSKTWLSFNELIVIRSDGLTVTIVASQAMGREFESRSGQELFML